MIKPTNEKELAEAVKDAGGPLAISGGGTRVACGPGTALSTLRISGITLYEPGALTIVVKAGTPVAEIQAALRSENQQLAFEPMDHRGLMATSGNPTIGGVVAANVSGPRRIAVGACRDYLLGVRFVDGQGQIVKNGGRVMKNVTGYDLVKLMAGSHGTLGVLSEVSIKVLPRAETTCVLSLDGMPADQAVTAMAAALSSPFEVSGAAHGQTGPAGAPVTLIRLEGFASSVEYRAQQLAKLLGGFGNWDIVTDLDEALKSWRWVRDVQGFHGMQGDVWKIITKASDAPELATRMRARDTLFDWGGGRIWALTDPGTDIRSILGKYHGHAQLIRAAEPDNHGLPHFQPQTSAIAAINAELRSKFDPRGILNPGLMQ